MTNIPSYFSSIQLLRTPKDFTFHMMDNRGHEVMTNILCKELTELLSMEITGQHYYPWKTFQLFAIIIRGYSLFLLELIIYAYRISQEKHILPAMINESRSGKEFNISQ
ncbi:hypothetical protein ACJX0J_040628, partial [Zea mays]